MPDRSIGLTWAKNLAFRAHHYINVLIAAALLVRRMRLLEMGDDTACAGRQRRTFASVNDAGGGGAYRCGNGPAGPISFIALVAPHIARRISGTARWG